MIEAVYKFIVEHPGCQTPELTRAGFGNIPEVKHALAVLEQSNRIELREFPRRRDPNYVLDPTKTYDEHPSFSGWCRFGYYGG